MPTKLQNSLRRALVEIGFILFLFYANLLMGEFTRSAPRGRTFSAALYDVITPHNFLIGLLAALIGYFVVESLRKKL